MAGFEHLVPHLRGLSELMKESRLFQILYYILERGRVTAPELAAKFEVSVRTIYRDIDWISNAGIPIFATQGKGGGIEIDRRFVLNKSMFSPAEKEQIMLALGSVKNISELEHSDVLGKMSVLFNMKNTNWIEVDLTNWHHRNLYKKLFDDIRFSIINKRVVSFDYSSNKTETMRREVKPIRLVYKAWSWYLYAFCVLRNDFRFFKLSRMRNLKVHDETYPEDYSAIAIEREAHEDNLVHLKLKFDKSQAHRVYDEFYDKVTEDENSLFVEIDVAGNYVYSYILSFGDGVEVLEPPEVRANLKTMLRKILSKYKT